MGDERDEKFKEGREKFDEEISSEQPARFGEFVVGGPWPGGPLDRMHRRGIRRAGRER